MPLQQPKKIKYFEMNMNTQLDKSLDEMAFWSLPSQNLQQKTITRKPEFQNRKTPKIFVPLYN